MAYMNGKKILNVPFIGIDGTTLIVDQTYNPSSQNPQSGIAVAEALESIPEDYTDMDAEVKHLSKDIDDLITFELNNNDIFSKLDWYHYRSVPSGGKFNILKDSFIEVSDLFLCSTNSFSNAMRIRKNQTVVVNIGSSYRCNMYNFDLETGECFKTISSVKETEIRYTSNVDESRIFFLLYRKDAQPISFEEVENFSCYFENDLKELSKELDLKLEKAQNDITEDVTNATKNILDESVNVLPFFRNWYQTRLFTNNGTIPSTYPGDHSYFLSSARYANDANDFPINTELHLSILSGYKYIIYIFIYN